jgi:aspartate-semialdehyde dehydrogenase
MLCKKKSNNVVIVGATGLVGSAIIRTLERLQLPVDSLALHATARSAGKTVSFRGQNYIVEEFKPEFFKNARWVFFSGKDGLSEEFCPIAASEGAWVIDNSASFRMAESVPLIVPEVNIHTAGESPGIIANPNCSTIQLAVALAPIRDKYGLKKVIVSTYQSASGAGGDYLDELKKDSISVLNDEPATCGKDSLAFNCIPGIGSVGENGRYGEEFKLENELRKILELPNLKICATAVRVPTFVSHGESVVIETEKPVNPAETRALWEASDGIRILDDFENRIFPTPRHTANTDPVWIGRIRKASIFDNDLAFWVVADNLLKGAALNAVQIAVALYEREK